MRSSEIAKQQFTISVGTFNAGGNDVSDNVTRRFYEEVAPTRKNDKPADLVLLTTQEVTGWGLGERLGEERRIKKNYLDRPTFDVVGERSKFTPTGVFTWGSLKASVLTANAGDHPRVSARKGDKFFEATGKKPIANKGCMSQLVTYQGAQIRFVAGHLESKSDQAKAREMRNLMEFSRQVQQGQAICWSNLVNTSTHFDVWAGDSNLRDVEIDGAPSDPANFMPEDKNSPMDIFAKQGWQDMGKDNHEPTYFGKNKYALSSGYTYAKDEKRTIGGTAGKKYYQGGRLDRTLVASNDGVEVKGKAVRLSNIEDLNSDHLPVLMNANVTVPADQSSDFSRTKAWVLRKLNGLAAVEVLSRLRQQHDTQEDHSFLARVFNLYWPTLHLEYVGLELALSVNNKEQQCGEKIIKEVKKIRKTFDDYLQKPTEDNLQKRLSEHSNEIQDAYSKAHVKQKYSTLLFSPAQPSPAHEASAKHDFLSWLGQFFKMITGLLSRGPSSKFTRSSSSSSIFKPIAGPRERAESASILMSH